MTIGSVLIPAGVLGAMGLFFGALLAVSSKLFHVEQDPRIAEITDLLPGANCGGCGFAGCSNCAAAIVAGEAPVTACPVGGAAVAEKVAAVMGVTAEDVGRMVAHVNCRGGHNAKRKYEYDGLTDCLAASKVAGGPLDCTFGCLGYGTCVQACEYGAMHIENGAAVVDAEKCVACGQMASPPARGISSPLCPTSRTFLSAVLPTCAAPSCGASATSAALAACCARRPARPAPSP